MDDIDFNFYKNKLNARRLLTLEEMDKIKQASAPVAPDNSIGRLSRMDAINQKSIFEVSMKNYRQRIELIDKALLRINSKEYGFCLNCEEFIGDKRLSSVPESPFCIKCMENKES